MRTLFNLVSEAHIFITLIFMFSYFVLANYNSYIKNEKVDFYRYFLLPAVFIFTVFIFSNVLQIYKLILMAETCFFVLVSVLELSKKSINNLIVMSLGIILAFFVMFAGYLNYLIELNLRWFCLAHISAIVIYFMVEIKNKGSKDTEKLHFVNAVASLVILFMYSPDGVFFMLGIRIFYFIVLFKNLYTICQNERLAFENEFEKMKNEFDEAVRLEVKSQLFYMNLSKEKMAEIAKLDDLTKIYNKKTILNEIKDSIASKNVKTFSLLIFDIDKFKNINDTLGHVMGDKCIVELANIAKESLRDKDMLGRYGGDEFFALIHGADLQTAAQVAERLRKNVEKTENPHYTISIGLANYPEDALTDKDLIQYADNGLYVAKRKGRNTLGYVPKKSGLQKK